MTTAAGLAGVDITSGLGLFSGEGFCLVEAVLDDGRRASGQLTPAEVRAMALQWLAAAEAAEHDAAVYAALTQDAGVAPETATTFIAGLRDRRAPITPEERP